MKDVHVCYGKKCAIDDDYEEKNCAVPIEKADVDDPLSLGPGLPGCKIKYCPDGMIRDPCKPEEKYNGSAEVTIKWPDVKPSDLIPVAYNNKTPAAQIEVEESYLPYITQYAYGFWYQFRFRSPVRMEVGEKRSNIHFVAGVTEKETYCSHKNQGDRALSLAFEHGKIPKNQHTVSVHMTLLAITITSVNQSILIITMSMVIGSMSILDILLMKRKFIMPLLEILITKPLQFQELTTSLHQRNLYSTLEPHLDSIQPMVTSIMSHSDMMIKHSLEQKLV